MSIATRIQCIFEGAFRRKRMERDMEAELRFHVARYTEDLVHSGIPREDAERQARIEFGSVQPLKEECREARGLRLWDEMIQDLRYAERMLRSSPGFALIAIVTLALGIGANTAIFSVVNAWVLKPLPYANPDQLVAIWSTDNKDRYEGAISPADLQDWRKEKQAAFEEICGWSTPAFTLQDGGDAEQILGARVSVDFFRMLGVMPQLGRGFLSNEDQPGGPRVAVISHELWVNRLGGDPALAGKTIQIDGEATTIVGILPDGFHLPLLGSAKIWMPLLASNDRHSHFLRTIARIKPGVSLGQATEYLKTVAHRLADAHPDTNINRTVRLRLLSDEIGREGGRDEAVTVFWLVACVLLLACSNVANLVVGRAVSRRKEMAVRLAIGAGRGRLLRQLLTENLAMFLVSAVLSAGFAMWGVRWIANAIPLEVRAYLPNSAVLRVDIAALLYTLSIALLTGLLFGLAPAIHCWRVDVNDVIKENSSRQSASIAGAHFKNCLVVFETALALVVLVAAGLLGKGLVKMYSRELGFNPDGLLTARVVFSSSRYSDANRSREFKKAVLERARMLPGVQAAAIATYLPYGGDDVGIFFLIDGQPTPAPPDRPNALLDMVSPEYFATMGIPLVRGRAFSDKDRDDTLPVALINQAMVRGYWPNQDPIGQRVRYGANMEHNATIVGVVGDTAGQNDLDRRSPQFFFPIQQSDAKTMALIVRGAAEASIGPAIRRIVHGIDSAQAVLRIQTMQQMMTERRAAYVIVGQVASFFAVLSLFLAALGIYAVMAYSVAARRQEFGIRLALGAAGRNLIALVIRQGVFLTVIGLAIGLAAAFGVTHLMSSILYQVSPTDAPTFVWISLLLFAVALFACYLPARRASRIEPTRALRYE